MTNRFLLSPFRFTPLLVTLVVTGVVGLCRSSHAQVASTASTSFEQTLPNGMRIICHRETATPLVSLQVFIKAGAGQEDADRPGLGDFVARSLFSGLTDETADMQATDIGELGGNVTAQATPDWTQVSALTLSDRFTSAAFLITNALQKASFDTDDVETVRQNLLSDIETNNESVFQILSDGARQTLYAGSPYTLPLQGTLSSVSHFSQADLIRYYNAYYVPKNFVFVVVGNIDPQFAASKIIEDMRYFPRSTAGAPETSPAPLLPLMTDPAPVVKDLPDIGEIGVMVGYRVPPPSSADYPAMLVANALLGGMKTSRLFTNIRDAQGEGYEVGSVVNSQMNAADVTAYVFARDTTTDPTTKKTVPRRPSAVEAQILQQITQLQTTPPSAAELERAKHFLIGSYKIRHERLQDRASLLGTSALDFTQGSRFDTDYAHYINAVTAEDVQRIASKYFVHPAVSIIEPGGDGPTLLYE